MSLQTCWRCLARGSNQPHPTRWPPQQPWNLYPSLTAAFTTSSSLSALPPKKKSKSPMLETNVKGAKKTFVKKTKKRQKTDSSKRPEVGERRALRKRIVLSNTNALEVEGLKDINAQLMIDESLRGQVLGIPGPVVDQLRAVEAFKVKQGWPLFRRPAMLMRKDTLDMATEIENISLGIRDKTIRRVFVGERGSGKTTMLLQAMTMAFLKGWVVINVPEAQDLILGHTEYGPLPSTNPTLYTQRTYTASLLNAISRANPILQDLQLSQPPPRTELPIPVPPNISLSQLAHLGAQDPEIAWPIFELLYRELTLPDRPPLLLCMDGLAHAMRNTHYISNTYQPIHAHQFTLINWFLSHLSGESPLPNAGLVLAATSESNSPPVPSLTLALAQLEGNAAVQKNPFATYDARVLGVFEQGGVQVRRVGGLCKQEARGLMEYWARSGVVRQRVDEGFVGEKWSLSGGGCVGELERAVVRMRV
ncbi:37S ribosomal protein S23 mitochondrial [Imshaugia aleurites]|uniref:Small ribosomal subunit protein mS29 n=1 Tax=Imshaugia aleurites TaxID=172621 RepID=A0A8H3J404_9LECA|nr:37S ribosomal protein S23 mitochondrial [Imshaugia aleurites]